MPAVLRSPQPLVVVGCGGLARETVAAVRAAGHESPWRLQGFVDDDARRYGTSVAGLPVIGDVASVREDSCAVIVATGNPRDWASRRRIVDRLPLEDERWATVVHPAASVDCTTQLGPGSIVLANVAVTTDVRIGRHCALMPNTVLTHDNLLGSYVTCGAGASLAGGVELGDEVYLGAGVLVREGLRIGAGSLVGMGSVVLNDVPPLQVWAGSPARRLRDLKVSGLMP